MNDDALPPRCEGPPSGAGISEAVFGALKMIRFFFFLRVLCVALPPCAATFSLTQSTVKEIKR